MMRSARLSGRRRHAWPGEIGTGSWVPGRTAWLAAASIVVVVLSGCATHPEQNGDPHDGAAPEITATPAPAPEPAVEEPPAMKDGGVEPTPSAVPGPRVPMDCAQLGAVVPELAGLEVRGDWKTGPSGYALGTVNRMVGLLDCRFESLATQSSADWSMNLVVVPEQFDSRPVYWGTGDNEPENRHDVDLGRDSAVLCSAFGDGGYCEGYVLLDSFSLQFTVFGEGISEASALDLMMSSAKAWGIAFTGLQPLRERWSASSGDLYYGFDCLADVRPHQQPLLSAWREDAAQSPISGRSGDSALGPIIQRIAGDTDCYWESPSGASLQLRVVPAGDWGLDLALAQNSAELDGQSHEPVTVVGADEAWLRDNPGNSVQLTFTVDGALVTLDYQYYYDERLAPEVAVAAVVRVAEAVVATAPRLP